MARSVERPRTDVIDVDGVVERHLDAETGLAPVPPLGVVSIDLISLLLLRPSPHIISSKIVVHDHWPRHWDAFAGFGWGYSYLMLLPVRSRIH